MFSPKLYCGFTYDSGGYLMMLKVTGCLVVGVTAFMWAQVSFSILPISLYIQVIFTAFQVFITV